MGRLVTTIFDPALTLELKTGRASDLAAPTGNVIVEGKLVMRPADETLSHALTFVNVNESAFVGAPLPNAPILVVLGLLTSCRQTKHAQSIDTAASSTPSRQNVTRGEAQPWSPQNCVMNFQASGAFQLIA